MAPFTRRLFFWHRGGERLADQVRIVITATDKTQPGIQSVEGRIEKLAAKAEDSLRQVATGAGIASAAVGLLANTSLQSFAEMERNIKSLDAVERGFLGTTGTLAVKARELQDEFFGLSATSGALASLISSGLGADKAANLIEVFKERAILLGNASIPLEQRLLNLAQAFKTEQSELGDASGLTENFSAIVARGSEIMGKNADEMSKAERAQAKYSAIVEMSAPFIGQASEMTDALSGKQASLAQETTRTSQAVGSALAPAYKVLLEMLTPLVQATRQYAEDNPSVVMSLTAIAGGALTTTTAVAGLAAAFLALRTAMGPIGLLVTAITAAVGAVGGLVLATAGIERQQRETRDSTVQLMREYEGLRQVLDDNTASTDQKQLASERLKGVLEKLFELQPQMRNWFNEEGQLLDGATEKWNKYRDAVTRAKSVELKQAISTAQKDLAEARKERQAIADEIRSAEETVIATAVSHYTLRFGADEAEKKRREMVGEMEDRILLATSAQDAVIARLEAQVERDQALLDAINEPEDTTKLLKPPPSTTTTSSTNGRKSEMSTALKAAMEDLQDLQALEQTPENLKRTLDKVREILKNHGAELEKLEKKRDLQRTESNLVRERAQAEFTAAMQKLQNDEQLAQAKGEPMDLGVIRKRLQDIQTQFADYLKANPDAAAAIDIRLAGIEPEEIRQKVKAAMDEIEQQKKLFGENFTPGMERAALAAILPIAATLPGTEGSGQVGDILDRIHRLDKEIQSARFEDKFAAIGKAFENAQVLAAGSLADMEKQLITEEGKGDQADPKVIESIKLRILNAVKPALEARKAALEELLKDTTLTDEQRGQVERELNDVKKTLYSQDVDAHRIATEARVAVERNAKEARTKLEREVQEDIQKAQREAVRALEKAEKDQLEKMKTRHKAEEDAAEAAIKAKERELQLYERQIAAEDRLRKIQDARNEIDRLNREGERDKVLRSDGTFEWRIRGMDDAQKALAEAERDHQQALHKERLQDEIATMRQGLEALRDDHRAKQEALTKHFTTAKEILETGFDNLTTAQTDKVKGMATALGTELTKALGPWATYASSVQSILNGITVPSGTTTSTTTTTTSTTTPIPAGGPLASKPTTPTLQDVIGPGLPILTPPTIPTIPAGLGAGGGNVTASVGSVTVVLEGATTATPEQIGKAVGPAVNDGVLDAVRRGMTGGTIRRKL